MELDSALTLSLVEKNDEAALAELVRRYVTLVYSAALRQVGGDTHLAEDVTQDVFTRFIRQASSLRDRSSLGGWFYSTTRHVAANVVRSERRRKDREIKAQMENMGSSTEAEADWSLLQPVLDDAMHEISESDRDAIRLRFLERLPMATVGERLGVTENAAAKRIERALEKLRTRFARHGITSTSIALATALEGKACVAAPAGLVAGVMESTLAAVTATGVGTSVFGFFTFMSTTKATLCLAVAAIIFGAGAVKIRTQAQSVQSMLAASIRSTDALNAKLTVLQRQLEEERNRVRAAEDQNGKLLLAAKKMQAASAAQAQAEAERITSEMVSARFKRAQELVRNGDAETALRELLWCYNVGMPRISNWGPVRTTSLLIFGRLGERYPPALGALRELREKALRRHEASATDYEATRELATINRALKDDEANIRFFDQLPPGDRRRGSFASASYDFLVAQRRYNDAAEGRPYSSISSSFVRMTQNDSSPADTANSMEVQQQARAFAIAETGRNIEMLAGSGDIVHAKTLAQRLLEFDSSESTKALIQRHGERAGHANLLVPTVTP